MDSLGDRMKIAYEKVWNISLPWRMPTILRLDGNCFHSFTKGFEKPFDHKFIEDMQDLAVYLCDNISTSQMAYVQSDEISILLHPYKRFTSEPFFRNEIQKMVSVSAGKASAWFSGKTKRIAVFDARVFVLPEEEVVNYFLWRQQDWARNSIQMLARSLYSHKELHKKSTPELQDLIVAKGKNWNDLQTHLKRGSVILRDAKGHWKIDKEIPIFSQDRNYIEKLLITEEV